VVTVALSLGVNVVEVPVSRGALVLRFAERSLVGRIGLPFGTSVLCVATAET